jgi:hypothetical protein
MAHTPPTTKDTHTAGPAVPCATTPAAGAGMLSATPQDKRTPQEGQSTCDDEDAGADDGAYAHAHELEPAQGPLHVCVGGSTPQIRHRQCTEPEPCASHHLLFEVCQPFPNTPTIAS